MNQHRPDPSEEAARILRQTKGKPDELPRELEAAWEAWAPHIHSCDERTKTLLRAAFETGTAAAELMPRT